MIKILEFVIMNSLIAMIVGAGSGRIILVQIGLGGLALSLSSLIFFTFPSDTQFIEVQRIDSGKYIQCIESQQYLVSQVKGGNSTTVMLSTSGKPIPCIERIYTSDQTKLPENKNKMFIEK